MKYSELLASVAKQPVFETGLLLTGAVNPDDVRHQLSLWVRSGRVIQLRRGVYTLPAAYQLVPPHPFLIANAMQPGSYISLQSALEYHGLIPEHVTQTLSATTGRPVLLRNVLGDFRFHHLAPSLFFGYKQEILAPGQEGFVALPEKALLDLVHLTPGGDDPAYLAGLRLQNLDRLDMHRLQALAIRSKKPKWLRAADRILALAHDEVSQYTTV
jgi:predicted transcriptional regulator of viral defense system